MKFVLFRADLDSCLKYPDRQVCLSHLQLQVPVMEVCRGVVRVFAYQVGKALLRLRVAVEALVLHGEAIAREGLVGAALDELAHAVEAIGRVDHLPGPSSMVPCGESPRNGFAGRGAF